jgi:secreted trypsin-like serine protease
MLAWGCGDNHPRGVNRPVTRADTPPIQTRAATAATPRLDRGQWPSTAILNTLASAEGQKVVAGQATQRLVGGIPVLPGELSWQASLFVMGRTPLEGHFCGGALISASWIATAAHCVDQGTRASDVEAIIGATTLSSASATKMAVQRLIVHEQWQPATFRNDIALLELVSGVSLTPIRLLRETDDALVAPSRVGTLSGWGKTTSGGVDFPDLLTQVPVRFAADDACRRTYAAATPPIAIADSMICAGGLEGDACQGDDGAPLHVSPEAGDSLLAGIASFTIGCGRRGFPGVYTRIAKYQGWIESKLASASQMPN